MKKAIFILFVFILTSCNVDPKGCIGYLVVENGSSTPIVVTFEVLIENGTKTSMCISSQTKDTVYVDEGMGGGFELWQLLKFEIAACDNPEEIIYKQNPIDKTLWIIDEKHDEKGFCYYSNNTFVFTDELINQ